jgi:alkylation response protein AidB-like acyl-CoA dehydrogenase
VLTARAEYNSALANYAKERVPLGKPISTFKAIQFKLAGMATQIEVAELLLLRVAKIGQIYEGTNEIQRVVIARKLLSLR